MIRIRSLDHLVLTVADEAASTAFYCGVLGMTAETFGAGRTALRFGDQKINLHPAGSRFPPVARAPLPGTADLCFLTETPVAEVVSSLQGKGIEIIEGPVRRTGARSPLLSVYVRDPDGNLIEIANELSAP